MVTSRVFLKSVGRRVGELRLQAKKTQAEVAEDLGFSTKYQQLVESGTQNLTLNTLLRFSGYFGIEPYELLRPATTTRPKRGRPRREPKSRGRA